VDNLNSKHAVLYLKTKACIHRRKS